MADIVSRHNNFNGGAFFSCLGALYSLYLCFCGCISGLWHIRVILYLAYLVLPCSIARFICGQSLRSPKRSAAATASPVPGDAVFLLDINSGADIFNHRQVFISGGGFYQ